MIFSGRVFFFFYKVSNPAWQPTASSKHAAVAKNGCSLMPACWNRPAKNAAATSCSMRPVDQELQQALGQSLQQRKLLEAKNYKETTWCLFCYRQLELGATTTISLKLFHLTLGPAPSNTSPKSRMLYENLRRAREFKSKRIEREV